MRAGQQLNHDFVSYLFKRAGRLFIIQALHTIVTQAYVNLGLGTHHQSPVADTNTYYFHAADLMAHSGLVLFRQLDQSPL